MTARARAILAARRAGVLLHPTSLPARGAAGELGQEARNFLRWLADAGFSVWQMLPIGPTHADDSPYQALSAHAGNPRLIDLEDLLQQGWLTAAQAAASAGKPALLRIAAQRFDAALERDGPLADAFRSFRERTAHWLGDFALFMALREAHDESSWLDWPPALRQRDPEALAQAAARHAERIAGIEFEQFIFERQWAALKTHANGLGIALFGDMPIFVHLDSADVWANQRLFLLGSDGNPTVVAGVPPDYFSATGQRWGNPLYDWDGLAQTGYAWWIERVHTQQRLFDLIRVDHFRGFEAYWEIDATSATAIDGRWVKAPGRPFFQAIAAACGEVPFVAENLGVITAEVEALRRDLTLPGMLVLQFAFDGSPDNPYLPHNHAALEVVYTGTHDNDTTAGWYAALDDATRLRVNDYLGLPTEAMPWPLIRCALRSVARLAIVPMQDLLELGSDHRMNIPGTASGNWGWRFTWDQVPPQLHARLRHLLALYGRLHAVDAH